MQKYNIGRAATDDTVMLITRQTCCYIRVKNTAPLFEDIKSKNIHTVTSRLRSTGERTNAGDDPHRNTIRFAESMQFTQKLQLNLLQTPT